MPTRGACDIRRLAEISKSTENQELSFGAECAKIQGLGTSDAARLQSGKPAKLKWGWNDNVRFHDVNCQLTIS
jgi:hypothetical protein